MTVPATTASLDLPAPSSCSGLPIPPYLEKTYWWAYIHPKAVRIFERAWLVNLILFGHYRRLCDAALDALGMPLSGRTLQVACVYGDLTARLQQRLSPQAQLEVVDILPIQLSHLAAKLPPDGRVVLRQADAAALDHPDGHFDQVLLFFLLHEQPENVRRATLAQALRVLRPGGKLVIVDYHRPHRLHPLRPLMRWVFRHLEPYAIDLWNHPVQAFMPHDDVPQLTCRQGFWGGLYQLRVFTR